MRSVVVVLVLLACLFRDVESALPFFKVFTQIAPIYRGRADPIVDPGKISHHTHKVFGASGFDLAGGKTNEQVYDDLQASRCTTASVKVDKSAYWIPDLYYKWPNGTFSLVPNGGLTIYYIGRSGTGTQASPDYWPFPRGFRMVAGNPFRRSYSGSKADQAIQWACLSTTGSPQTNGFPTDRFCQYGLRAQVFFPQCWDGRLDSPNHQDHVAYPNEEYNNGNCPASHPRRLLSVFYEIWFYVDQFPHGTPGVQPFVVASGDPTGYGLHGDFLNGWDVNVLDAALDHPSCFSDSTNNGNNPERCTPLQPHIKASNTEQSCTLDQPIPNYEDLGLNHLIHHLPGNNPLTYGPANAVPVFGSYAQTILPGVWRVLIRSRRNNLYVSSPTLQEPLIANVTQANLHYPQVFVLIPFSGGRFGIATEGNNQWVSANSNNGGTPLIANRNSASDWEHWGFSFTGGSAPTQAGQLGSILSYSNNKYVTVQANGQLFASSTTVGTNEQFYFIDANAGVPDTRSPNPV